jgi:ABC-2 type transport system permease protein
LLVLLAFVPFVWGLGIADAGLILTFRRGGAISALAMAALTLFSGAYFPLDVLPGWAQPIASANPVAIAVDGMRGPLLGGTGWESVPSTLLTLVPLAVVSLALGIAVFRRALQRERVRGSLGLY